MSPEKQREIASKGGRAAHEKGTAHEWTADEARIGRPQGRSGEPRRPWPSGHSDRRSGCRTAAPANDDRHVRRALAADRAE